MATNNADVIRRKIIDELGESDVGLSGLEMAKAIGMNRITLSKYLGILSAEGVIGQKHVGNAIVWFVRKGTDSFTFPDDYDMVAKKYLDLILGNSLDLAHHLIRNSLHMGASTKKIMTEVLLPASESVLHTYEEGNIGNVQLNILQNTIRDSALFTSYENAACDADKNAVLVASDRAGTILSAAAASVLRNDGWVVSDVGDMSESTDTMLDLDMHKLLRLAWPKKRGLMILAVFSKTGAGMGFFSEALESAMKKMQTKKIRLLLFGPDLTQSSSPMDLTTNDFDDAMRWFQSTYDAMKNKK